MDEYIDKKIKTELVEKDFHKWNKESIIFLVSIFEYKKLNSFYDFNLILLNDYIKWYKNYLNNDTKNNIDMYNLESLINLYSLIKHDIRNEQNYNYEDILDENIQENIPENVSENVPKNISENEQSPGAHSVELDISKMSKGAYFVTLKSKNGNKSKQLLVN
jgi:hypothetical protein